MTGRFVTRLFAKLFPWFSVKERVLASEGVEREEDIKIGVTD